MYLLAPVVVKELAVYTRCSSFFVGMTAAYVFCAEHMYGTSKLLNILTLLLVGVGWRITKVTMVIDAYSDTEYFERHVFLLVVSFFCGIGVVSNIVLW